MRTLAQLADLDWVRHRAATQPTSTAIHEIGGERRSWTWVHFDAATDRMAAAFHGKGTVAIQSADPFVVAAAVGAALRTSTLLVPLNMRWTADERAARARDIGATLVIDTELGARLLADDAQPTEPPTRDVTFDATLDAWLADDPAVTATLESWPGPRSDERPVLGLFTSGTTGQPRLALLPARALVASALAGTLALGVKPTMTWALCMPLYHVGGLSILVRAMVRGLTVCVLSDGLRELAHVRPNAPWNVVSVVPTMLEELVGQGVRAPDALALTLVGGGPARGRTLAAAATLGWKPRFSYGMTECAAHITAGTVQAAAAGLTTVGRALPGMSLEVEGAAGGPLKVWGPSLMLGYLGHPRVDGPWYTGDYGVRTADGDLQLLDRRQDIIISGGENIYPAQIEQVLLTHAALRECCAAAVADDRWGQVGGVLLVITRDPGSASLPPSPQVLQTELEGLVRTALGSFRVPRHWLWVETIPRTPAGKVDRAAARELLRQATVPT